MKVGADKNMQKTLLIFFSFTLMLFAQQQESEVYKQYSTGRFVEILQPYQTGDYAVGIQAKGKLANVLTNFGQLSSFHVFAPSLEWPAFGEGQDDEQQYGWGVDFMIGFSRDDVIESFQDPASNLISREWQPADENLFSGNVTVSENDLTPIMATSDNRDTWPLNDSEPFWPGLFRQDTSGTVYEGQFTSERDLYCVFTDAGNENPRGIRVEQTAYSFSRRYAEDFLVYRFNIKNTSGQPLTDMYPGMMVQFLIDFDNHDLINFIDSNNDGEKDLIYMWDQDNTPRDPWSKVGYIGLVVVKTPQDNGITNFHYFHDEFMPGTDEQFWMILASDTTGLPDTSRIRYFHGDDLQIDDVSFAPDLDPEGQGRGGEVSWGFSSGPVTLAAGDSMQLEIAIVCGEDEADLLANVDWVWFLANNAWNGSNPPDPPVVQAWPGDGKVTVIWDAETSESSTDNITGEKDFEGYKVYRSSDRGKTWGNRITNNRGDFIGFEPIAQFDLDNNISGSDPLSNAWLGNNSGLKHTFVDTNVVNGLEYWYTVTAYDRGDDVNTVESLESSLGLTTDEVNVAVAVPQALPSNFTGGSIVDGNVLKPDSGLTDGKVSLEIIDATQLKDRNYKINFNDQTVVFENGQPTDTITTFTLRNEDTGEILLADHPLSDESGDNIPVVDGFRLKIEDVEKGKITFEWTKVAGDTCTFYWDTKPIGANDIEVVYTIHDFRIVIDTTATGGLIARQWDLWSEVPTDSTIHLPLRIFQVTDPENPIDVSDNTWLGEFYTSPFGLLSPYGWDLIPGGAGYSPQFPFPDRIIMEYVDANGDTSGLRLVTNNGPADAVPPSHGDEFTIRIFKPLTNDVVYTFSTTAGDIRVADEATLKKIRVVPNPYFVSSSFDDRIMFTNLPNRCEIRIFNVAGDLVKTISHSGGSSSFWDLRNQEGLSVAYGVYVYVVKTPGGGKQVDKFSVIR